jgi:hypothetical protein
LTAEKNFGALAIGGVLQLQPSESWGSPHFPDFIAT